jgi:hypothetical protein
MSTKTPCVLNGCPQPQGIGTWVRIMGIENVLPVCEQHWQALRIYENDDALVRAKAWDEWRELGEEWMNDNKGQIAMARFLGHGDAIAVKHGLETQQAGENEK